VTAGGLIPRWARAALVAAALAATLWGKSAFEAAAAFRAGEAAERSGDLVAARARYDEAALWRCPLCPWSEDAAAARARLGAPAPPAAGAPWIGPAPRDAPAALAGIALLAALGAAALWAARGAARPWAVVTALAALAAAAALGAA
jgi:hypothetical protein